MFSMSLICISKSVISRSNASETFLTEGLQGKEYKLDNYKELRNSQPQEVTQGNKRSYMAWLPYTSTSESITLKPLVYAGVSEKYITVR